MIHIGAEQIAQRLNYTELGDAIGEAFACGQISAPDRVHISTGADSPRDALLLMSAWRPGGLLGVKVVTVNPGNAALGQPTVQATLMIADARTGTPIATLDATEITRWRTAATSLLAARLLARPTSETLVLVGAGSIAGHLLAAYREGFCLRRILIWNRTLARAEKLASSVYPGGPTLVQAVPDLKSAIGEADIVTCATLAEGGLIEGAWVQPGTHVDLVGAYTVHMRESDDYLIQRADLYVDTIAGALREAGDLIQPLTRGVITAASIRGDLSQLMLRQCKLRTSNQSITLFKSVGHALEDLVCAEVLLQKLGLCPSRCFT